MEDDFLAEEDDSGNLERERNFDLIVSEILIDDKFKDMEHFYQQANPFISHLKKMIQNLKNERLRKTRMNKRE